MIRETCFRRSRLTRAVEHKKYIFVEIFEHLETRYIEILVQYWAMDDVFKRQNIVQKRLSGFLGNARFIRTHGDRTN